MTRRVELRIVSGVIACAAAAGFDVVGVLDCTGSPVRASASTMVERGDSFIVCFGSGPTEYVGSVTFIPGNGEDVLHDWSWRDTTAPGRAFAAALEAGGY